tara:strand:+ start:308 stop:637 length:330 start_codon:yes stop_codon:yes gene_type:complete
MLIRVEMIFKKIFIGIFFVSFLNGCVQGTAFLGPVYTLASTGNVYQTGLTYGSSEAVKKITGKTTTENIKNFINDKDTEAKEEENYDEFYRLVKNRVEKTSKILNLANQ